MQLSSGRLTLAATDLGKFLACRHLTALDIEVALGKRKKPPVYPDPFLKLLAERGLAHEKHYTEDMEVKGTRVLDLSGLAGQARIDRTVEAMKAGEPAIAQGALASDGWFGLPDFLLRTDRRDRPGSWSYEAYDTKLARETRGSTILQLSLYSELIARVQGSDPEHFYVVTPIKPEQYRVKDFDAYYRLVKRRLAEACDSDPDLLGSTNYPDPVDYCDVCRWRQQCNGRRREDDHLSLIAGISRTQRREFEARGYKTLEGIGDLDLRSLFRPTKGSKEALEKVQDQARVQLRGRREERPVHEMLPVEEKRGLTRLPEPSPGDVFLDLEGDHFAAEGGREYLFGMTVVEPSGETRHVKRWAFTGSQEKDVFEAIIDEILRFWDQNPGMHVYHYAPYEPGAFKRLMGRHTTRELEMDRLLRGERFIDLCSIVKQSLRASVESYSIKDLECFYEFDRKADLHKAGNARRVVEFALETDDRDAITDEVRSLVEDYNEEDCVSAMHLRRWLEGLREELVRGGTPVTRPPLKDGAASEEQEKRSKDVQDAMDALLAGVPPERKDRDAGQQARWLLAHMLEFHWREEKVSWWELYRLCAITDEDELRDERAAVFGLTFRQRTPPTGRERLPVDRYTYPPQEFEARAGDDLKTQDALKWGTVEDIDRAAGWVDVRKTTARKDEHPRVAIVHKQIRSAPIPSALMTLARDVIAHGTDDPACSDVARELLLGHGPRLKAGKFSSEGVGELVAFARRTVLDLDRSVLSIQGPPGAGKTYTGARMIVECVRKNRKVGVSAVSHKVIKKLLEDAVSAGKKEGVRIHCVHKDEVNRPILPGIDEVKDGKDALAAIRDGSAQVISGTAWLWSRADAVDAVDVLFVDEAGQASLANVVATAQAAKSLVLLGDPQQLEQPQRGTHPPGVDASALEHILGEHKTIPPNRGIFLDRTRRLPPAICAFTSELFYEGRLESHEEQVGQRLSGAPPYEGAGLWFVPVDHDGNSTSSPEEVKAVEAAVSTLLVDGSAWTDGDGKTKPLMAKDILVVAPFNAQVNLLHAVLGPRNIRVGTVDKFQGQEGAVVIYSMATSRPEDAPRGMEFLYDLNRLNVATSRARCACVLVASPRLLEPECKTPRQMRLANAMGRYAELARMASPL